MPTTPRPVPLPPVPSARDLAEALVSAVCAAELRREEPGYLYPDAVDRLYAMAARILGTSRLYGVEEEAREAYHASNPY